MTEVIFRSDVVVEMIDHLGTAATPVEAARVSTKGAAARGAEADARFLKRLLKDGHLSPFEHQIVTFRVEAPIFVTRQIARHRIASYNEQSGRYMELDAQFYVPGPDRPVKQVGKTMDYEFVADRWTNTMAEREIKASSAESWQRYQNMLADGVAKEMARVVLPTNLYSNIWITMNTRSLLNFFHLRTSDYGSHPQYEIEQVAQGMMNEWFNLYPETALAAQEAGVL